MDTVACGVCGKALDENPNLMSDERQPCPACGSTRRNFQVAVSMQMQARETADAAVISGTVHSIAAVSDLLLQAIVVPGEKTAEGTLIQAVAIPWFDIIEKLRIDPNLAFQIPARTWEEIIAGAYHKAGFDEVTLTPRSGDHGRDVIAVKKGLGSIRVVDQVKAYKPGHLVIADDVIVRRRLRLRRLRCGRRLPPPKGGGGEGGESRQGEGGGGRRRAAAPPTRGGRGGRL